MTIIAMCAASLLSLILGIALGIKIEQDNQKENKMRDIRELTEIFKREFPETQLKRGSLLAIFGMWKYEGESNMRGHLDFLYDIGIITSNELQCMLQLARAE